jgi:hypothetical protein
MSDTPATLSVAMTNEPPVPVSDPVAPVAPPSPELKPAAPRRHPADGRKPMTFVWRSNKALAFLIDGPRCDGCVADHLGVSAKKATKAVARWAKNRGVVREKGTCPGCGETRLVSRVVPEEFFEPLEIEDVLPCPCGSGRKLARCCLRQP